MSKYSGKCDLYDSFYMKEDSDIEETLKKTKIYAYDHELIPLDIKTEKDLVPYYPYLVCMSYTNKEGYMCYYLSIQSFVDIEEQERLTDSLNSMLRYYRKCKRKKEPFDIEEACDKIFFPQECHEELAKRVQQFGEKAVIDGLHTRMHQVYRKELYEEMLRVGYTPLRAWHWVYKEINEELLKEETQKGNNE